MVMRSGGGQTGTGHKQLYWGLPVLCDHVLSEEQQLQDSTSKAQSFPRQTLPPADFSGGSRNFCCYSSSCRTWPPHHSRSGSGVQNSFPRDCSSKRPSKYRVLRGMEKSVSKNTSPLPFITHGHEHLEKSTKYGLN